MDSRPRGERSHQIGWTELRDRENQRLAKLRAPEWQPIESAPKDGTEIVLLHPQWVVAQIAKWDWVEGPEENAKGEMVGGFCLWHLRDDTGGAMCDGLLWPDEEWRMPTHWMPLPASPGEQR